MLILGYYFYLPLWSLLLLNYLSVNRFNHLANSNLCDKFLLMPILCQALSWVVTMSPCLLNQSYHHPSLHLQHRFYFFSMFFYTSYCPLKLFLGLQLSVSGAIIKQFTKDNHISRDYGYSGLGTQGRMWTNNMVLPSCEFTGQQKRQTFNDQAHGDCLW